MASITRESNGRRTIQFVCGDGKRRSIRLGKVSQRHFASANKWQQPWQTEHVHFFDAETECAIGSPVE